jgi:hypothetical protein
LVLHRNLEIQTGMSAPLFGLPAREEIPGREGEGLLKRLQMTPDSCELCPRGLFRIADGGWGSEPFEALEEDAGGSGRVQDTAIEKHVVPAVGDFATGGEFHDRDTGEDDPTQRAFSARAQHTITIADGDQAGCAMFPLELGGAEENRELAGSVANTVSGRPRGAMQDSDSDRLRGCGVTGNQTGEGNGRAGEKRTKEP